MPKQKIKTDSVFKESAHDITRVWLKNRGYQMYSYNAENASDTVDALGIIIAALNYSTEHRKKFKKEYSAAKKLYSLVHKKLREWEIKNCQKVPFKNLPSEILRRELQDRIDEEFRAGLRDINKYLENIEAKLLFVIGKDLRKRRKSKKK